MYNSPITTTDSDSKKGNKPPELSVTPLTDKTYEQPMYKTLTFTLPLS